MQEGGLLLIDEISLANDSVLERLNSVFEQDRTLLVTEKSAAEAHRIEADPRFNMVATMNPSGDFGKKELSPALRNRMTEIWVESYFDQMAMVQIQEGVRDPSQVIHKEVPETVDLFMIISKLCKDADLPHAVSISIFNVINFLATYSKGDTVVKF